MADLMNDLIETTVKGQMDIYKVAFDEGYKQGYEAGKREVWAEVRRDLRKGEKEIMDDPIEWEFGVPASQVDLERLHSEASSVSTIMALIYFEQFRLKAPITYMRYKKWVEDNNKWMGCIKLSQIGDT